MTVCLVNMGRHDEWRKIAKRERRRRIRTGAAIALREKEEKEQQIREAMPEYQVWLKEQEAFEIFGRQEVERINEQENQKWLKAEKIAQQQWLEGQQKIERSRLERVEQEIRIKKEWEREQQKVKEAQERLKEIEEENKRTNQLFLEKLEQFLSGDCNDPPGELVISRETKPGADFCPFFAKTASCRFGDMCSRNHKYPGISNILLAPNFYTHFGLDHSNTNEYDTDIMLEYDDADTYREYKEFFYDVLSEFKKWGRVTQFKVCKNMEKHLRGNTYVEFAELRSAVAAYRALHTRWYAGRQISLQFCSIQSWKNAICGMYLTKRCPKGGACNFLHVFQNPKRMYDDYATRSLRHSRMRKENSSRNWRWSESPEPVPKDKTDTSSYTSKRRRSRSRQSKDSDRSSKRHNESRRSTRDTKRRSSTRSSDHSERSSKRKK